NGAVQYHFGDRENLVREIVLYRTGRIIELRSELLARIVSQETPPRVRDYVHAFVMSMAIGLADGNHYLRFLARFYVEQGGVSYFRVVPESTITLTKYVMQKLLPHLTDEVLEERWQIIMTSTVHTLAGYQSAMKSGTLSAPLEHLLDNLIDFLTA